MTFDGNGNCFLTLKDKDLPNMMLMCRKYGENYTVEFINVKRQEAEPKIEAYTLKELNDKFKQIM